ncbi:von Willebrand factor type A domain-containing protein [Mycena floridula]|nr:von Willebrand factor type A domain-containing protein [Mycena floridula]
MLTFWGLCYYHNHQVISLPLLDVHADVKIKDLVAQVTLSQTFTNESPINIQAVYSFPVPARAAVSGFSLVKEDGTRVLGTVQEKAEAQQIYNTAIAEGQLASLMVQQTPDVFQVSVGNILPSEKVVVELVYATELTEDEENDSIRFLLPSHVGSRYGQSSSSYVQSQPLAIEVAISVESLSPIRKISCPSHSVAVELGPDPALATDLPFSNYARVSLATDSALSKDFVLAVEAIGLDSPRCVAELHPKDDTVAMCLTLIPKFNLPDPSTQEFIFLIDRSGSMDGSRISAARKALVIMLRSLPRRNTFFQIVSFGSHADALWPKGSRLYDQGTLDEATRHVDGMQADYGGTEIRAALETCFQSRKTDRPTSVFVLTDGDAWDLDSVLEVVKKKVEGVQSKSGYLRVFCLGIGDSVSTAMCEGIARMGNGACMMVGDKEATMAGKIARLFKAARTPPISDLSVDWGRRSGVLDDDDFELVSDEKPQPKATGSKFNIFNQSTDPLKSDSTTVPPVAPVVLGDPSHVQQSPQKLLNLFPGVRLYVYAIVRDKTKVPQSVIIRGKTLDGAEIELPVPATLSQLADTTSIHSLAARKIIQDLEDGRHDEVLGANSTVDLARLVKAHIVRLGKTYSISSQHTSFVAVDWSSNRSRFILPASVPKEKGISLTAGIRSSKPMSPPFPGVRNRASLGSSFGAPGAPPPAPSSRAAPPPPPARASAALKKRKSSAPSESSTSTVQVSTEPLEALARLQSFDGSFSMQVIQVVKLKEDSVRAAFPGLEEALIATVLAMAFIAKQLKDRQTPDIDAWEGIYSKAKEYIEEKGAVNIEELLVKATGLGL